MSHSVETVQANVLTLAAIDCEALPLFSASKDGRRVGYEVDIAEAVAAALGLDVRWYLTTWDDMFVAVKEGRADAVLCGQGYSPERAADSLFTLPYAIFNETVLVRAGDAARCAQDLAGYRIAAIDGSLNMKLARSFADVKIHPYGDSVDVMWDMLNDLHAGRVDAVVDDDVVFIPIGKKDARFDIAFTAQTRNPWGMRVKRSHTDLVRALDDALRKLLESKQLEAAWQQWFDALEFPFSSAQYTREQFQHRLET